MREKLFDFCENKLSEEEKKEILEFIHTSEDAYRSYLEIKNFLVERKMATHSVSRQEMRVILSQLHEHPQIQMIEAGHRRKLKSRKIQQIAYSFSAALILFFGYAIPKYIHYVEEKEAEVYLSTIEVEPQAGDVSLVLADGEVVSLNQQASTNIARKQMKISTEGLAMDIESVDETPMTGEYSSAAPEKELPLNYVTVNSKEDFMLSLPDGTRVYLRNGAKLGFPEKFSKDLRSVEMEGEGYFVVTKDESKPFIIGTAGTQVRVVGTEFNLKSDQKECQLEISMTSGVVSVKGKNDQDITVTKDKQLVMDTERGTYRIGEIDGYKYKAWKDGYFVFIEEDLRDITQTLSQWYGINIVLENTNYNSILFNGKFQRSYGLDKIIRMLEQTYDFHFYLKDQNLYIN